MVIWSIGENLFIVDCGNGCVGLVVDVVGDDLQEGVEEGVEGVEGVAEDGV